MVAAVLAQGRWDEVPLHLPNLAGKRAILGGESMGRWKEMGGMGGVPAREGGGSESLYPQDAQP